MNNDESLDTDLLAILNNLLQLNPYHRWSPSECLKMATFDDIRCKAMENIRGDKIKLDIDQDGAFDHKTGESILF